jgi:hypothetical protein
MTLIIILLLVVIIRSPQIYSEHFLSNNSNQVLDLNDMQYGTIDQVALNFAKNHKITSFPLPLPLQDIKNQKNNLSSETLKEIDFVLEISNKSTDKQKISADKYEKNILNEFIDYCKNNKLFYDTKYLTKIADDIKALCLQLKLIYNRPRPYQLGFYLGKVIVPRPIINSATPSYPSYSTLLSKTLANVISYNNPKQANDLHTIAKDAELSRLIGGFNYPSDNKASLQLAAIIKKYIKYMEIKE